MAGVARDLPTGVVEKAYGKWANVYDALCQRLFRPAHLAAAAAANRIGGDVLEVGVGTGLLLPLYGSHVRVRGVDLSEAMLAKAEERVARLGLRNVVGLEVADIHTMPHPDESYDAIVLPFVLTLVAEPERALDNCRRMLKPGGEIIVVSHFRSRQPVLAAVEQGVAPLIAGVGLRPDFPIPRIEAWCAGQPDCQWLSPRPVGVMNAYTLLRIGKRADRDALTRAA